MLERWFWSSAVAHLSAVIYHHTLSAKLEQLRAVSCAACMPESGCMSLAVSDREEVIATVRQCGQQHIYIYIYIYISVRAVLGGND